MGTLHDPHHFPLLGGGAAALVLALWLAFSASVYLVLAS
jgi:hypothetical protein